jgi:dTDP-4-amino-4,6-dideoxygalactose transaminase
MKKIIRVNSLELKREYELLKKSIGRELEECLETQHWILGEKVTEFEQQIGKYLNAPTAIGVASGTDALVLSLRAMAIECKGEPFFDKKDEIITTPFTFIATAEAIVLSGATPVFVDINPDTFNIDPDEIRKVLNKNTVGILPVHLYGLPCNMGEILSIAKENKLFVVEDTAQAFGASYNDKKAGTFGNFGAFSFFPSKNMGAWGDAGMVVAASNKSAELIKVLRNHGQTKQYNAEYIGYNSRLDSLQAALLLAKLKHIDNFNELRCKVALKYNHGFKHIRQIQIPLVPQGYNHVYHQYTIKVPVSVRDKLLNHLNGQGVAARIYYPVSLHKMKAFNLAKKRSNFKVVDDIVSRVLSIPMHPFLLSKEIDFVIEKIDNFFA